MRILTVIGTRPEAIKMAPVVLAIRETQGLESVLCLTGQHVDSVVEILRLFEVQPDIKLDLGTGVNSLGESFATLLVGMEDAIKKSCPDVVLVQGDTTSATAAAMAAFLCKSSIGHVEAGLRTYDLQAPWPEEGNRQLISRLSRLHFAPTENARQNLLREGIRSDTIEVTGNTVIDALRHVQRQVLPLRSHTMEYTFPWIDPSKRLILVTAHRRENHANGIGAICRALVRIAARGDCQIAFVKHMNPLVQGIVDLILGNAKGIKVLEPQPYDHFVWLMSKAFLIVTDSGGVQEEAPALGVPVFITRCLTERLESVDGEAARIIGIEEDQVYNEIVSQIDDPQRVLSNRPAQSPYGDGTGARKISDTFRRLAHGASLSRSGI